MLEFTLLVVAELFTSPTFNHQKGTVSKAQIFFTFPLFFKGSYLKTLIQLLKQDSNCQRVSKNCSNFHL